MDLSNVFHCIPHYLLIGKLEAYGFKGTTLKYFHSYINSRRQCICLNDTYNDSKDVISGVPRRSIVARILFNAFLIISFFALSKLYYT